MSNYAYLAEVAGAALGVVAGIAQWTFGDEIPDYRLLLLVRREARAPPAPRSTDEVRQISG
jgi:hypothetical protein